MKCKLNKLKLQLFVRLISITRDLSIWLLIAVTHEQCNDVRGHVNVEQSLMTDGIPGRFVLIFFLRETS